MELITRESASKLFNEGKKCTGIFDIIFYQIDTKAKSTELEIKRLNRDIEDMKYSIFFNRCKYCKHLTPSDFSCHVCGFNGDDDYTESEKIIMNAGKNPKYYKKDES